RRRRRRSPAHPSRLLVVQPRLRRGACLPCTRQVLRLFLPSGQIHGARSLALARNPQSWLGFRAGHRLRRRRGSGGLRRLLSVSFLAPTRGSTSRWPCGWPAAAPPSLPPCRGWSRRTEQRRRRVHRQGCRNSFILGAASPPPLSGRGGVLLPQHNIAAATVSSALSLYLPSSVPYRKIIFLPCIILVIWTDLCFGGHQFGASPVHVLQ
uniref:Uncharacterized protein n=1 Tax=Aegilops tauschii subsp. strangulata TaxID=200361 RepID=A0A453F8M7_AEGTS